MKRNIILYTVFSICALASVLTSCIDSQNLSYSGPTVLEFKNLYLEKQNRLGVGNFSFAYPNIIPSENLTLSAIGVRQPSATRTGTITATTASTTVTGVGTLFTTELSVGSVLKDASGNVIGFVAAIATPTSLTLTAVGRIAVAAGSTYRASIVPGGRRTYADSVLVQLVGPQRTSNLDVTFTKDAVPAGSVQAVEGVHFDFVRNASGSLVIKGNSSSGYIYINVYDALGTADPERVVLPLTLQESGGVKPSENYKTFTLNIIK